MKYSIILTVVILSYLSADIEIVASPTCEVETLSKSEVKKLFMLKASVINNEMVTVLDNSDKTIYKDFVKEYLNKSKTKINIYWKSMIFTGRKLSPQKVSTEELDSMDYNSTCHLSYVEEEQKPKDWKIIKIQ